MGKDLRREDRPGLYCVELRTSNWPASLAWYREVLGLMVLVRVPDEGYALLDAGETRLALLARDSVGDPSVRISLAFEVHDLQTVISRLTAHGAKFSTPGPNAEGLREVNTTDPDGNRIRLFSWPRGA